MESLNGLVPKEKLMQSTEDGFVHGVTEALKDIRYFREVTEAIDIAAVNGRADILELIENRLSEIGILNESCKIFLKWKKKVAANRKIKYDIHIH